MKTFYDELKTVLAEVNSTRGPDDQVSVRKAVMHGLLMQDSYCTRIKDGTYKPTREKLEALAVYLGIEPTRFDTYVRRWLQEEALTNPDFIEFGRILASFKMRPTLVKLLLTGASKFLDGKISAAVQATVKQAA